MNYKTLEDDLFYLKLITTLCKKKSNIKKKDIISLLNVSETKVDRLLDFIRKNASDFCYEETQNSYYIKKDLILEQELKSELEALDVKEVEYALNLIEAENSALKKTVKIIRNILNYNRASCLMSRIPDIDESNYLESLLSCADLQKEQYFLSSNIIELIMKNNKTAVYDIEYMKVPNEVPQFEIVPYSTDYKLENRGNRFLDLTEEKGEHSVEEYRDTNITHEVSKNCTGYAYSGTKVYAKNGSRVFAYNGSTIIARANSIVLANKDATVYAFPGAKLFENKSTKDGNIIKPMYPKRVLTQTKIFNCVFIRPFIYQGGKYSYICTAAYDFPSKINLENIIKIKESKQTIQEFMNCKNNIKVFGKTIYKTTHQNKKFTWKDFNNLLSKWSDSLIDWDKGRVQEIVFNFETSWYKRYLYPELILVKEKHVSNKILAQESQILLKLFELNKIEITEKKIMLRDFYFADIKEFYSLVALHSQIESSYKILDAIDEVCINSLSDPMGLVQGNQFNATIAFSPKLAPYILSRRWPENRIVKQNTDGVLSYYKIEEKTKWVIMEIITSSEFELVRWLRALGTDAKLVDTNNPNLEQKLKTTSKALYYHYCK